MRNSRGEWETWPSATRQLLKDVFVPPKRSEELQLGQAPVLRPALMEPDVLRRIGAGELVLLDDGQAYGREQKVADELNNQLLDLAKWVRRMTGWNKRVVPVKLWRKKSSRCSRKNWPSITRRLFVFTGANTV